MTTRIDDWPTYGNAVFSEDEKYRYTLSRTFLGPNDGLPINPKTVMFIMLNPSTADADQGDPTIRRCMTYAKDWGYDKLVVCNLFALRSTDPRALRLADDPIGPENDTYIARTIMLNRYHDNWTDAYGQAMFRMPTVVCAWGEDGKFAGRGQCVRQNLLDMGVIPHYLKLNLSGEPCHPLYLPKNLLPTRWV